MTDTEFCYWLQGYIELRQESGPFKATQAKCIRKHIALARKARRGGDKAADFLAWLDAILEVAGESDLADREHMAIQKKLGSVFKHEIDGSYGDVDGLDEIHGGGSYPGQAPVYRC